MRGVVTAGGLLMQDGKVLLIESHGKYAIPKGHLEGNETLEQAALREVLEETGYRAKITGHCGTVVRTSQEKSGEVVRKTIEVFAMEPLELTDGPLHEVSEWVGFDKALGNMFFAEEKAFLERHLPKL